MSDEQALQPPLITPRETNTRIRQVPLDQLPPNDQLGLQAGDPSLDLVQSILTKGQLQSITLVEDETGNIEVEEGRSRIAAFRVLRERFPEEKKWQRIRAEVCDSADRLTLLTNASASNNQRRVNVLTDIITIEHILKERPNIARNTLAELTGINPSTLSSRMTLFKLTDDWMFLFKQGKLLPTTALDIAKLSEEVQNKLWVQRVRDKKITKEMITDAQRVRKKEVVTEMQEELFPKMVNGTGIVKPQPDVDGRCPHCGQELPDWMSE